MMVLLSAPEDEDGDDDDDGVDFTDVTLVYKDANQHKAHTIILSWPENAMKKCPNSYLRP